MRHTLASLLRTLSVLGLLACGGLARADASEELRLYVPGTASILRVTERDFYNADIQLSYDGKEVRGRAGGQILFLEVKKDRLVGLYGHQPTQLVVAQKEKGYEASGTFAGRLTRLRFGPEEVAGYVGPCSYTLRFNGEAYEGSSSCGGLPMQGVRLSIPPSLLEKGPVVTAMGLALLLG